MKRPRAKVGDRFGRLTLQTITRPMCWCICDCGTRKMFQKQHVVSGHTKSCGCYRKDGDYRATHGHHRKGAMSPTYQVWASMMTRCLNPNCQAYPLYGGRGITVCERWKKFENFIQDVGDRPTGLTIERRNNDGNYEPTNCYWATRVQQANNTRKNVIVTFRGETSTFSQMARKHGLDERSCFSRLYNLRWPMDKIFSTPINHKFRPIP